MGLAALLAVSIAHSLSAGVAAGVVALERGDYEAALTALLPAAESGNRDAQFNLGRTYESMPAPLAPVWYEEGSARIARFVQWQESQDKALRWYREAAEQGLAQAQHSLGRLIRKRATGRDYNEQAAFWFRKAAEQGDAKAQVDLASVERALSRERARVDAGVYDWSPEAHFSPRQVAPVPAPKQEVPSSTLPRDRANSTGSGFRVSREHFITNYHVAGKCRRLRIAGESAGRLVAVDPRADLALISVAARSPALSAVRIGKATLGEPVTVAGFPLNGLLSGLNVTTGIISSLSGIRGDASLVQFTAPVQAGNSGGPLLDAGGNVIGVVVSKLDAEWVAKVAGDLPQNVNFAIKGNVLASFLNANGIDYKTSAMAAHLSTQEVAKRAEAFTVMVECWK